MFRLDFWRPSCGFSTFFFGTVHLPWSCHSWPALAAHSWPWSAMAGHALPQPAMDVPGRPKTARDFSGHPQEVLDILGTTWDRVPPCYIFACFERLFGGHMAGHMPDHMAGHMVGHVAGHVTAKQPFKAGKYVTRWDPVPSRPKDVQDLLRMS